MGKIIKRTLQLLFIAYVIGLAMATPAERFHPGDVAPIVKVPNIHGHPVEIPGSHSKYVHLQFRRFAGCPICNLHLQSFVSRNAEIESKGIHEVVVFHSTKEALLPYQGHFPFDVIGDPLKYLYDQYGVKSSLYSLLDFRAWPAMFEGNGVADKPKGEPEGGILGLPADFLIASADGRIVADHYGRYSYDQWTVDELLALAK
jgi:peroxiredoxin